MTATRLSRPSPTWSWAARSRSSRPAPVQTRTPHPRALRAPSHYRRLASLRRRIHIISDRYQPAGHGLASFFGSVGKPWQSAAPAVGLFRGEGALVRACGESREKEDSATPIPDAVPCVAEPEAKPVPVPMTPGGGLVRKFGNLLVGEHGSVRVRINKQSGILCGLFPCPSADVKRPSPISASSTMHPRTTRSP
jgi:hypothetical protein